MIKNDGYYGFRLVTHQSVIRYPAWSKSGLTRICCVMESDWFGSNQLKFCFILFNPYRVVRSVCIAVSLVRLKLHEFKSTVLVHYNQELGVTESRDWSIDSVQFCHVGAEWRLWRQKRRAFQNLEECAPRKEHT